MIAGQGDRSCAQAVPFPPALRFFPRFFFFPRPQNKARATCNPARSTAGALLPAMGLARPVTATRPATVLCERLNVSDCAPSQTQPLANCHIVPGVWQTGPAGALLRTRTFFRPLRRPFLAWPNDKTLPAEAFLLTLGRAKVAPVFFGMGRLPGNAGARPSRRPAAGRAYIYPRQMPRGHQGLWEHPTFGRSFLAYLRAEPRESAGPLTRPASVNGRNLSRPRFRWIGGHEIIAKRMNKKPDLMVFRFPRPVEPVKKEQARALP